MDKDRDEATEAAVRQLSQLSYFISPSKNSGTAEVPHGARAIIGSHLQHLGFRSGEDYSHGSDDGENVDSALYFTPSGIKKLVGSKIKSEVLDVYREKARIAFHIRGNHSPKKLDQPA